MGECGFSHARHQSLPIEDAKRLSRELSELLAGVDIIGLRAFGPNPSDVHIRKISQAIDTKNLRGALGMIEALQYGDRAVKNGEFRNTVLTSAWVHLGFLELLDVVLDNAPRVVVITGRHELEKLVSEKLKNRLVAFLPIPVQASDQLSPERPFHYPTRYKEIIEALRTDLRGTLVLAGAGILARNISKGTSIGWRACYWAHESNGAGGPKSFSPPRSQYDRCIPFPAREGIHCGGPVHGGVMVGSLARMPGYAPALPHPKDIAPPKCFGGAEFPTGPWAPGLRTSR
jgi:hypothetical protein